MTREPDEFEGIDISGPWGGVRFGSGAGWRDWESEDDGARAVRRRVRQKLDFYRHLLIYVLVVGGLALLNWAQVSGESDENWWVLWVAGIWGAFVALQFFTTFISPSIWGREVEERMVQRELERRRRRGDASSAGGRIEVIDTSLRPPDVPRPPQ